ncbi:MAG: LicD family protein [Butyrivibrio sp.]|nr:LicD family protein [Butyrivibrio sp.]
MLEFGEAFFQSEERSGFQIRPMIKRLWATQMDILFWVDEVCNKYGIKYIMCYGSMLGAVRHNGYIPWDDDIDIAMLRADYRKFMEIITKELPPYLFTLSLLPGAKPPKEMTFNINNGNRFDTSPEFLSRFHGCPYATGIDLYVFDRVPDDPDEYAYQDRMIKILDRLLMLQWEVDAKSISEENHKKYLAYKNIVETELDYTFNDVESWSLQILRLLDLACALCEDSCSDKVENREQVIYYGAKGFREDHFTDRIYVPFEGVMEVPVPRDYDTVLRNLFGDYQTPRMFTSQHDYPIYRNQRDALYKAYKDRGLSIPKEFLENEEDIT